MARKEIKVKKKKTASEKPKKEKKDKILKGVKRSLETSKLEHFLVPEHQKCSVKEKEEVLKRYNITIKELPKIFITDPAIRHLDVQENDIVKVVRKSPTAGNVVFYRGVVND